MMACGRRWDVSRRRCALGEHVSRRNLLRRLWTVWSFPNGRLSKFGFERARFWEGNNYIKLFGSARNVVEKENCDQRDEKKNSHKICPRGDEERPDGLWETQTGPDGT